MQPWTNLGLFSNAVNGVSQGGTSTALTQLPNQSIGQRILGGAVAGGALGASHSRRRRIDSAASVAGC